MKKRLSMLFLLVLAIIASSGFWLPNLVNGLVARGMSGLTGTDEITVQALKKPAVAMLGGQFDQVLIHANNANIDRITFSDLDIALEKPEIDMGALFGQQKVLIKSVQDINLTAVVTQEELARYLNQSVKGVKDAAVKVENGKVKVTGQVILANIATIAVAFDGKIVVGEEQKLKFVTEKFSLNNGLAGYVSGSTFTEIPLVNLKKLPFGVKVRSISMENCKIIINADNHLQ